METVTDEGASGYPAAWLFDKDGDIVEATFARFERGPTRDFGPKPIAVLDIGGTERSLWLVHGVLFSAFRRELQTRTLEPGERISIHCRGRRQNEDGSRSYVDYAVKFHDAPQPSVQELFDLEPKRDEPAGGEEQLIPAGDGDDSIPF